MAKGKKSRPIVSKHLQSEAAAGSYNAQHATPKKRKRPASDGPGGQPNGPNDGKRRKVYAKGSGAAARRPTHANGHVEDVSASARASSSGRSQGGSTGSSRYWRCMSVVDQQAAFAVQRLLQADSSRSNGASLKSLTLAPHIVAKKATYAVTCQVVKCA